MIYETERLIIRKLVKTDIDPFHQMQANKNVMIYTDSGIKTYEEDVIDLANVIDCYEKPNNRFWIWAVIRKKNNTLIGTVALIEYDENKDEVGFRFLEKYWNNGYGFEVLKGLLTYAKEHNYSELYAEVYVKNIASEVILKKAGFTFVKEHLCTETNLLDRLLMIEL